MKVIAGFALASVVGLLSFPMLLAGGDSPPLCAPSADATATGATPPPVEADDDSPTILGPSTATVDQLTRWWTMKGKGQPRRLRMPINTLITSYLEEGSREGVRGDIAFAQAVLETGWFTNTDTSINNFAGVGHYDTAASGFRYPSPVVGVRAQIQLLKKFVQGNGAPLASPDVAPSAGARATTWAQLATRWATHPDYWTKIDTLYSTMSGGALAAGGAGACPAGTPAVVGDYAFPVELKWYNDHPAWFTKPRHDYPAADIPVPTGTPIFAAAAGTVVSAPAGGRCGLGVIITGDDGATYLYCHGSDGGEIVRRGDRVSAGDLIVHSASTGNSTGPHLHFGIRINGRSRCPQPFLVAVAERLLPAERQR